MLSPTRELPSAGPAEAAFCALVDRVILAAAQPRPGRLELALAALAARLCQDHWANRDEQAPPAPWRAAAGKPGVDGRISEVQFKLRLVSLGLVDHLEHNLCEIAAALEPRELAKTLLVARLLRELQLWRPAAASGALSGLALAAAALEDAGPAKGLLLALCLSLAGTAPGPADAALEQPLLLLQPHHGDAQPSAPLRCVLVPCLVRAILLGEEDDSGGLSPGRLVELDAHVSAALSSAELVAEAAASSTRRSHLGSLVDTLTGRGHEMPEQDLRLREPDGRVADDEGLFTLLHVLPPWPAAALSGAQWTSLAAVGALQTWARTLAKSPPSEQPPSSLGVIVAYCTRVLEQVAQPLAPWKQRLEERSSGGGGGSGGMAGAETRALLHWSQALLTSSFRAGQEELGTALRELGAAEDACVEAATVEVLRVLDCLCAADARLAARVFGKVQTFALDAFHQHVRRTGSPLAHCSLVAALAFLLRHGDALLYDLQAAHFYLFGRVLKAHFQDPYLGFEVFALCERHRERLRDGRVFAFYFPSLLKSAVWHAMSLLPELEALLPALQSQVTLVELFHRIVDLPLLAGLLERPDEGTPALRRLFVRELSLLASRHPADRAARASPHSPHFYLSAMVLREAALRVRVPDTARVRLAGRAAERLLGVMLGEARRAPEDQLQALLRLMLLRRRLVLGPPAVRRGLRARMLALAAGELSRDPELLLQASDTLLEVLAEAAGAQVGEEADLVVQICSLVGEAHDRLPAGASRGRLDQLFGAVSLLLGNVVARGPGRGLGEAFLFAAAQTVAKFALHDPSKLQRAQLCLESAAALGGRAGAHAAECLRCLECAPSLAGDPLQALKAQSAPSSR